MQLSICCNMCFIYCYGFKAPVYISIMMIIIKFCTWMHRMAQYMLDKTISKILAQLLIIMCTIIRLKDNINEIHGEINRKSKDLKCVHNIWSGLMIPQIAFRISYNFCLLCLSCSPLYFSINNAAMKISLHEYPISVISMHTFTISVML